MSPCRLTRRLFRIALASALAMLSTPAAQADHFLLTSGGRIEGTLLNRDQAPRRVYEIQTASGAKLTLPAEQVQEVLRQSPLISEYEKVAPNYGDTVDEQWKLAEWCKQNKLPEQRKIHLERILAHETDHVAARHALGYVQIRGKWTTTFGNKTDEGYQLYRGQWRTAQDIAIIEQRDKVQLANKEWLARLKRWRSSGAMQQIAAVRDASAVPALVELLKGESNYSAKSLYLDVLGEIATPGAVEGLVYVSLNDPNVEVFHTCAEIIERLKPAGAVGVYRDALKSDNNVRLNRAANMLGRLGDESAISPLIDVLITTHKVVIPPSGRGAGDAVSTGFSADGGTSFQNGQQTKVFHQTVQNEPVLAALRELTGVTFGYEIAAWRRWHDAQRSRTGEKVELR